ncbi:glycosyltransferase [Azospirillum sp. Sh1]|uniref:glycosyltransferase n=1 Tax=Azospirillum sp. Sh1 TaxID=2607285 RepID=UPI0011ED7FD9|nr:glycosyltransferase [Azospirillum sp. Sh1]KAA0579263.1 glycosyltransferase [Azospirillum sp. Sh1]
MTSIQDILIRAAALHQAGDVDLAARLYRLILVIDPAHMDALHLLGLLKRRSDQRHGATIVARALRLQPDHPSALINQAGTLMAMGRLDEAMAHFRRKLVSEPDCLPTLTRLGTDALACGRIDEAERLLRRATAMESGGGASAVTLRCALERCATARSIRDDAADPSLPPGLVVRGVFRDSSGYAYLVRRFVQELVAAGITVRLVDLNYGHGDNLPDDAIDPLLLSLDRPVRAKAVLSITTPPAVECIPGLKTINFSMFEGVDIPPLWTALGRRHDHVLVATDSSRTAWLRGGHPHDRIHICPAGVDDIDPGGITPTVITDHMGRRFADYPVRILNVSDFNDRKNLDGLLRVWVRATRREDPAALLLKPGKGGGIANRVGELLKQVAAQVGRPLTQVAPIFLVEGKLSDAAMMSLHAASTHYWSMSHGEGWDLPMAQAGAMGLTLLAPDHSAYHAYLDGRVAHMIPSAVTPGIGAYAGQSWWSPDEDEAARLLRAVIDDPAGTRRSAQAHLLEHFSWQAATRRLIALLRELDAL